ncbi:hypothetical protein FDUTEX481_06408 [Tolypothrix sp. PCC 7601]|nr:hypothetical protein FDUTEX481_06408 [Tolypothrix sp. PCC 7601]
MRTPVIWCRQLTTFLRSLYPDSVCQYSQHSVGDTVAIAL